MLGPTLHHLFETLPYLAEVMQVPLVAVQSAAAALALTCAVLLVLAARTLTRC
jgi:hypothetical protein